MFSQCEMESESLAKRTNRNTSGSKWFRPLCIEGKTLGWIQFPKKKKTICRSPFKPLSKDFHYVYNYVMNQICCRIIASFAVKSTPQANCTPMVATTINSDSELIACCRGFITNIPAKAPSEDARRDFLKIKRHSVSQIKIRRISFVVLCFV